jgi:hypothetical protein
VALGAALGSRAAAALLPLWDAVWLLVWACTRVCPFGGFSAPTLAATALAAGPAAQAALASFFSAVGGDGLDAEGPEGSGSGVPVALQACRNDPTALGLAVAVLCATDRGLGNNAGDIVSTLWRPATTALCVPAVPRTSEGTGGGKHDRNGFGDFDDEEEGAGGTEDVGAEGEGEGDNAAEHGEVEEEEEEEEEEEGNEEDTFDPDAALLARSSDGSRRRRSHTSAAHCKGGRSSVLHRAAVGTRGGTVRLTGRRLAATTPAAVSLGGDDAWGRRSVAVQQTGSSAGQTPASAGANKRGPSGAASQGPVSGDHWAHALLEAVDSSGGGSSRVAVAGRVPAPGSFRALAPSPALDVYLHASLAAVVALTAGGALGSDAKVVVTPGVSQEPPLASARQQPGKQLPRGQGSPPGQGLVRSAMPLPPVLLALLQGVKRACFAAGYFHAVASVLVAEALAALAPCGARVASDAPAAATVSGADAAAQHAAIAALEPLAALAVACDSPAAVALAVRVLVSAQVAASALHHVLAWLLSAVAALVESAERTLTAATAAAVVAPAACGGDGADACHSFPRLLTPAVLVAVVAREAGVATTVAMLCCPPLAVSGFTSRLPPMTFHRLVRLARQRRRYIRGSNVCVFIVPCFPCARVLLLFF